MAEPYLPQIVLTAKAEAAAVLGNAEVQRAIQRAHEQSLAAIRGLDRLKDTSALDRLKETVNRDLLAGLKGNTAAEAVRTVLQGIDHLMVAPVRSPFGSPLTMPPLLSSPRSEAPLDRSPPRLDMLPAVPHRRTRRGGRPRGSREKKTHEEWLQAAAKIGPMRERGKSWRSIGQYLGRDHKTVQQWWRDYQREVGQESGE